MNAQHVANEILTMIALRDGDGLRPPARYMVRRNRLVDTQTMSSVLVPCDDVTDWLVANGVISIQPNPHSEDFYFDLDESQHFPLRLRFWPWG